MKSSVSLARGWKATGSNAGFIGRVVISLTALGGQKTAWVAPKQLWQNTRKPKKEKAQSNGQRTTKFVYVNCIHITNSN